MPESETTEYRDAGHRPPEMRTIGGLISGVVGFFTGAKAGDVYTESKMLEFDTEVNNLVRNDILSRKGGAGAGVDSAGMAVADHTMPMLGGLGPGAGSHAIKEAHELNLIRSGKYPFAKTVRIWGRGTMGMAAGAAGALAAAGAYLAMVPKKKPVEVSPEEAYAMLKGGDIGERLIAEKDLEARRQIEADWEKGVAEHLKQKTGQTVTPEQMREANKIANKVMGASAFGVAEDASAADILKAFEAADHETRQKIMETMDKSKAERSPQKSDGTKDWQSEVSAEKNATCSCQHK